MIIKPVYSNLENVKNEALMFLTTEENSSDINFKDIEIVGFNGEKDQLSVYYSKGNIKRLIMVGLGKEKELDSEKIRKAVSLGLKKIKDLKLEKLSIFYKRYRNLDDEKITSAMVEGLILGNYEFNKYKSENKSVVKECIIYFNDYDLLKNSLHVVKEITIICNNVNFVRNLVNESSDIINPVTLTEIAKDIAKRNKLKIKILSEKDLKEIGMNLILQVGNASKYPPRLVILEYNGNKNTEEKLAIVGKGITFDSGGLNLKESEHMVNMKMDMSGAATVLGAIKAAAELKINKNVVAVIPLCENMIGQTIYRPGNIIKSYSGKTVEIENTDAEGRLILADALAYTVKGIKPNYIIDLATLTGAATVVFGEHVAPLITNDDKLAEKLFDAGQKTYERVWRLPLYEEYKDDIKSEVADLKNMGYRTHATHAGTIVGAAFLANFIENVPWAHIDIASVAWLSRPKGYYSKFATGFGLRLLIEFFKNMN